MSSPKAYPCVILDRRHLIEFVGGDFLFSALISLILGAVHLLLGIGTPQKFPPPLSAAEERAAFVAKSQGDMEAREKLILHNLRLVAHIVRKYYGTAKNSEDLVSIGTIGLVKAVDTFNPTNGTRFATYAAKCIQNEILMHFRAQKKLSCEVSINETIDVDRDGNPLTYIDVIATEDNIEEEVDKHIKSTRVRRLVETVLDTREREIIYLRYGLSGDQPLTQREVAELLGISRSYVSRIEKSALDTLREYC
ncbi:MAG: RNA polymerase sporulation sigma factor SigK [Clostridia bacterium]|nr:RNA polymerase sporulation sigma factor SigK [Clostridia bacterium]MBR2464851.1 RNA polymerase sporulation sigma factor SigK [Clostridia bacterium]MBR3862531.1 RNA polymerase sporulation sigma factor SigK [Clostridia bacterium]